eukprot:scaffold2671_cov167-Amphora_coffeaeformis.AAC.2
MGLSRTNNLPSPGYFSSNHVLVNRERAIAGVPPLQRCIRLDTLARQHAHDMARQLAVHSSVNSIEELQDKLQAARVGENTWRGSSIRTMHQEMMRDGPDQRSPYCRHNLLAPGFTQFGMGTAVGTDGKLYLVQLFAGDSHHDNKQPQEQTRNNSMATTARQTS